MVPLAGSKTAPWTNAVCMALASLHGPSAGLVAVSWYGVASPCAVSGFAGTMSVQLAFGAAFASAAAVADSHRLAPTPPAMMTAALTAAAMTAGSGTPQNGSCPRPARRRRRAPYLLDPYFLPGQTYSPIAHGPLEITLRSGRDAPRTRTLAIRDLGRGDFWIKQLLRTSYRSLRTAAGAAGCPPSRRWRRSDMGDYSRAVSTAHATYRDAPRRERPTRLSLPLILRVPESPPVPWPGKHPASRQARPPEAATIPDHLRSRAVKGAIDPITARDHGNGR